MDQTCLCSLLWTFTVVSSHLSLLVEKKTKTNHSVQKTEKTSWHPDEEKARLFCSLWIKKKKNNALFWKCNFIKLLVSKCFCKNYRTIIRISSRRCRYFRFNFSPTGKETFYEHRDQEKPNPKTKNIYFSTISWFQSALVTSLYLLLLQYLPLKCNMTA